MAIAGTDWDQDNWVDGQTFPSRISAEVILWVMCIMNLCRWALSWINKTSALSVPSYYSQCLVTISAIFDSLGEIIWADVDAAITEQATGKWQLPHEITTPWISYKGRYWTRSDERFESRLVRKNISRNTRRDRFNFTNWQKQK